MRQIIDTGKEWKYIEYYSKGKLKYEEDYKDGK